MKNIIITAILAAFLSSCAATRPVGTKIADAAGTISAASVKPMDKLQASKIRQSIRAALYVPTFIIGVGGTVVAVPVFFVGVCLNLKYLD